MHYDILGKGNPAKVAFLTPQIYKKDILKYYHDPHLSDIGYEFMVCDLYINRSKKKTPAKEIKEYLEELLPNLIDQGIELLVVNQPEYFKVLTKQTKTDATIGDIHDSVGGLKVTYIPHYSRVFYDPDKIKSRIAHGLTSVKNWFNGTNKKIGTDIIKKAYYPKTTAEKLQWLNKLLKMDCDLTCDIEGFSLKHYDTGIGTITFCWNEHEGIAFEVDDCKTKEKNIVVRAALKDFFKKFKRKMIYHNICFDVYALVYQLFMDHILDQEGLLEGLKVLLRDWDCTQIISYLATNSCAGNELGLKAQAQEFAGNYAVEEINDITKIPLDKLLEYNLIDGLSTWYVWNKNKPIMVIDQQEELYETLFKDAVVDVIQMQLTGLPINMKKVEKLNLQLEIESRNHIRKMVRTDIVKDFIYDLEEEILRKKNEKLKTKQVTRKDLGSTKDLFVEFNPNSSAQLQTLLFNKKYLGLPVLETTKTGLPATDADTLENLLNHTKDPLVKEFLETLMSFKASAIILNTFLPAFLKAKEGPDGWHYLFGNFRIGGTVSGRLSSNGPNLQNIPSSAGAPLKKRLAKLIKECFEAPEGWIFCGLDFDSLEDRISALTTKDPEKLKVYTDGYDGHCLRAYSYFGEHMPDIDPTSVESINSIAEVYKQYRQDSKAPTFALTYQGTFSTLVKNCGFTEALAKSIEAAYHKLYAASIEWVQQKLEQASKVGYITAAFGLRVRTPLLHQTVLGVKRTPKEAAAEQRTAGNALGQSWGLLNNRAASAFMKKVRTSKYKLDIKPCAHIHDAQYYLIRDEGDMGPLKFMNDNLPKEVAWQKHPEIQHDKVKLSGSVEIYWPNWNHGFDIPNAANDDVIKNKIKEHLQKLEEKGIKYG